MAVIEGVRPVIEALRAGRRRVHEISIHAGVSTPGLRELRALAQQAGIPLRDGSFGEQRVVAAAEPFPEEPAESLIASASPRFLVALDRVTDVGNLGSIARSAETAGAAGLLLEHQHAPPIGPGALRSSAGALEHLRVGRAPSLPKALGLAFDEGFALLAADPDGEPLALLPAEILRGSLIWVFGSEDLGLRPGVLKRATLRVGIPVRGRVSTLGVAAAAAYLLQRTAELRAEAPGGE